MRVAHIITRLILGGAQENTVLCCKDLIDTFGDDVLLVTGPALGPEGSLVEQARDFGIPLLFIESLRRAIHPLQDFAAYRRLKSALRSFAPDVVHTHSAKAGILGRYAAWSLDVPAIVHTVHGAPFHSYQNRLARAFFRGCERRAARRCHALISVADAMTEQLVAAGVASREMFTTIYSGMDVDPFLHADESRNEIRAKLGFERDHVVVGKVARLFHLKGHGDLIAAARTVVERSPKVRYLLIGDGILRERLQREIDVAGLQGYFQFAGCVAPWRVAELMGAMDVLVHTSLREGLARALPQALIAARPVVSYDVDGAREVVIDGVTGLLLKPRDVNGVAAAIVALAEDADMRRRLGAEGRRRYESQFRHENTSRQIRALYRSLV